MTGYYPNSDRRVPLGRPKSYPWDEWADGKERVLEEGQDFKSMAESFVMLARRTARIRGKKLVASTTSLPGGGKALEVEVEGEKTLLLPGKTYVMLKFVSEEANES